MLDRPRLRPLFAKTRPQNSAARVRNFRCKLNQIFVMMPRLQKWQTNEASRSHPSFIKTRGPIGLERVEPAGTRINDRPESSTVRHGLVSLSQNRLPNSGRGRLRRGLSHFVVEADGVFSQFGYLLIEDRTPLGVNIGLA